jgi:hypothetical protein
LQPAQIGPQDLERESITYLSQLSGLDEQHFSCRGRPVDRTVFGQVALRTSCIVVDTFPIATPGASDSKIYAAMRKASHIHYRTRPWRERQNALNAAFLALRGGGTVISPLTGAEARILGNVMIGPRQATLCLDQGRLAVLLSVGQEPLCFFYPTEKLILTLSVRQLAATHGVGDFLNGFLGQPTLYAEWIKRALRQGLQPLYIIGDNRPGHFVKQSLAYLDFHEEAIASFARKGGMLAVLPDLCAIDPLWVFPKLADCSRITIRSDQASIRFLRAGFDAYRIYRATTHPDAAWLRKRLEMHNRVSSVAATQRRFKVLISVDAERMRIINQIEAFRFVLRKLGEACADEGSALDVVWDGWTVPNEPDANDLTVMERIRDQIGQIMADLPVTIRNQTVIYDRSSQNKIPEMVDCDLVLVTQGTGAVIPCWLLQRKSITYQTPTVMADRSCIDESVTFNVDQRAIYCPPPEPGTPHNVHCFELKLWGLEDALVRAVGDRLTIRREQAGMDAEAELQQSV